MAGWDSPNLDPQAGENRSLTKGEIEAFWRARKGTPEEEEHAAVASTYHVSQARTTILEEVEEHHEGRLSSEEHGESCGGTLRRSSSLPLTDRRGSSASKKPAETIFGELKNTNGWWTRSNWSFLNDPPIVEKETLHRHPSKRNIQAKEPPNPEVSSSSTAGDGV
ncbi:unnamed protein product [Spirodela intermedia]|uniref:Uncharacterized protein n=1 Tax=Spirodela intermedia TaxID=51605 RepID=A0A7I8IW54_SPIIN|nr:unnamed protein product [Spirodela intermedia]CAA6661381.1 unnamed protein product [Spirodela intermedia]